MRVLVFARRCIVWLQQAHDHFGDGEFHSNQINKCMRPTKLLTISAIAGLSLIGYGKSAHAAPVVSLGGTVSPSCTLAVVKGGTFRQDGTPASRLYTETGNYGDVKVTCNDSSKSLKLEINSSSSTIPSGIAKIQSIGSGGVFGTRIIPGRLSSNLITIGLPSPTDANGDTVSVNAEIAVADTNLLKAGTYTLVVDATITP